jgi:hypothetical protein
MARLRAGRRVGKERHGDRPEENTGEEGCITEGGQQGGRQQAEKAWAPPSLPARNDGRPEGEHTERVATRFGG